MPLLLGWKFLTHFHCNLSHQSARLLVLRSKRGVRLHSPSWIALFLPACWSKNNVPCFLATLRTWALSTHAKPSIFGPQPPLLCVIMIWSAQQHAKEVPARPTVGRKALNWHGHGIQVGDQVHHCGVNAHGKREQARHWVQSERASQCTRKGNHN